MEKAKEVLERKGLRATIHRIMILSYLMKTDSHPCIDDIYTEMLNKIPTISKTTVYNTLNSLVEYGLVDELDLPECSRYDYRRDNHAHFYCVKCKKVYDLNLDIPKVSEFYEGHEVNRVQFTLIGICKNCLKKQKEEQK